MTTSAVTPRARQARLATVSVLIATVALLGGIFWRECLDVYRVWVGSTAYNHCFLVLPLVAYLIWERRGELSIAPPRPQFLALALLPLLSLQWLLAAVLSIHEAQQLIVLTMLEVVLLSLLGWDLFRRLMAPLLYLYFLVPSGMFLVPALQDVAAIMAVKGLHLVGVPVYSDGVFIEIPAGRFVIAEACAGLRFLIASVAFGVFFAILSYRSWIRRAVFIALSVLVPIAANGVRVFGIIYAAHLLDSATAAAADHVVYGWVFFSAILIMLIAIGRSFADRPLSARENIATARARRPAEPARMALVGLIGVVLAGLGPAYAVVLERHNVHAGISTAPPPAVAAPWQSVESTIVDWTPIVFGADRTYLDAYTDGKVVVHRFIALYVARGLVNNLVRSDNRVADGTIWLSAASSRANIEFSGRRVPVSFTKVVSGDRAKLVISFYVVGDTIVSDPLSAKLLQAKALFSGGTPVSAFVAMAVDVPDGAQWPVATIERFLAAMEPVSTYLRTVSH